MSLEWTGITSVLNGIDKITDYSQQAISQMTNDLFDFVKSKYIDNLSGTSPSTSANPLPVGIDTGDLISHAEQDSHLLNQYAFQLANYSGHSDIIEFGTTYITPRLPMQDAINQLELELQIEMDSVMTSIMDVM